MAIATQAQARDFDECAASGAAASECDDVANKGQRSELTRNVSFAVAGVLAAATIGSFFIERRDRNPPQVALRVSPQGLIAAGTF